MYVVLATSYIQLCVLRADNVDSLGYCAGLSPYVTTLYIHTVRGVSVPDRTYIQVHTT